MTSFEDDFESWPIASARADLHRAQRVRRHCEDALDRAENAETDAHECLADEWKREHSA